MLDVNRIRQSLKAGPFSAAYGAVRNLKRKFKGEPLVGTVRVAETALNLDSLLLLRDSMGDHARYHFSLALAHLETGTAEGARQAEACLQAAELHKFESTERLQLYRAATAKQLGNVEAAKELASTIHEHDLTDDEKSLRQQILLLDRSVHDSQQALLGEPLDGPHDSGPVAAVPRRGDEAAVTIGLLPSVSVIVPNYNYARFLKERIRSIQQQTFGDFEIILVDDASTDESADVLEELESDDRLVIKAYKDNSGGVYIRRNKIIEEVRGDWLWFAEADDSAHPKFLEKLMALAATQSNLGIIHSRVAIMDQAGRLVTDRITLDEELQTHLSRDYVSRGYDEAVKLTSGCYLATSSGLLMNRKAVLDVGGYDLRLKMSSDWDLYLRLMNKYDIAYLDSPLAYYRSHTSSVTKTTDSVVRTMEDAYCVINAYGYLKDDTRVSEANKTVVQQRLKGRTFDMFVTKSSQMPSTHRFILERLQEVAPDPRAAASLRR